jgi:single-strand DNA-binding protein
MMNRVVLVGRLTKDPELRYTPNGVPVATFTLAVNRSFTNQAGEREADFINCVIWRKPAENVANFLKKGSLAGVDGRVQTRNYEGTDGKRVYVTEILAESVQFLEPRNSQGGGQSSAREEANRIAQNQGGNGNQGQRSQSSYNGAGNSGGSKNNYTRVDDDPFANDGRTIDISDDDLPF